MIPEKIYNVSKTQLSVARYYGGTMINGSYYNYNPKDDTLEKETKKRPSKKSEKNKFETLWHTIQHFEESNEF